MLSIPNKVFSPYSKTYCTKGTISRWTAAPWASSSRAHHADGLQEVEEIVKQRPFVQPVHPVHQLLPIQPPGDTRIVAPGHLPTQPFCQVLCELVPRVCPIVHSPP